MSTDSPAIAALIAQRQAALKAMRDNILDAPKFSAASKREAELAARIRRLRNADCIQNPPEICR